MVIEIILALLGVGLVALVSAGIGRARRKNGPPRQPPGFTIVERRAGAGAGFGHAPPAGRDPSPGRAGFTFTVSTNPTAICRLTGRPVRDCGCKMHQGRGTS